MMNLYQLMTYSQLCLEAKTRRNWMQQNKFVSMEKFPTVVSMMALIIVRPVKMVSICQALREVVSETSLLSLRLALL